MKPDITSEQTETLDSATILYLDDDREHRLDLKRTFEELNFQLKIEGSIEKALKSVRSGKIDIFICDLNLSRISKTQNGFDLLKLLFEENSNRKMVMALYSAFISDLTPDQLKWLVMNDIHTYDKNADYDEMILNLDRSYKELNEHRLQTNRSADDKLNKLQKERNRSYKHLVIEHLKKVSNQELSVNIPGSGGIKVKDLIKEVMNDTEYGINYMTVWLQNIALINEIRGNE